MKPIITAMREATVSFPAVMSVTGRLFALPTRHSIIDQELRWSTDWVSGSWMQLLSHGCLC